MSATIMSMVMRLPASLPGTSVASGLRPTRARGAVKPGLGPGLCQVQARRSLQTLPSAPLVILDSRASLLLTSGEVSWRGSSAGGPGAGVGAQRTSALTNEPPVGVQIGDKGLERGRTDKKKPHDSNVSSADLATPGLLCHRFGHHHPVAATLMRSGGARLRSQAPGGDGRF